MLTLFVLTHMLMNVDKSIVAVLAEPIKRELGFSDSGLALLSGAGFTIVFALAGFPLGRWADRGNRRDILALCLGGFSLLTGAGAFAATHLQLLLSRFGVAVGEAGGGPAMVSSITDMFPPERRATAMSIYYLGVPLGLFFTYMVVTALAEHFGWRAAMLAVGATGMTLALLIRLTGSEAMRGGTHAANEPPPPFRQALRAILAVRSIRHLIAAATLAGTINSGLLLWAVSALVRSHGFTLSGAGAVMAVALGLTGAIGTFGCGWIADRIGARDPRLRCWLCAGTLAVAMPLAVAWLLLPDRTAVIACVLLWAMFNMGVFGPIVSLCQSLVVPRLRGTTMALYLFSTSLIGVSLGAQIVGLISDLRAPIAGPDALRDGMLVLTLIYPWAILHLLLAARPLRAGLAAAAAS